MHQHPRPVRTTLRLLLPLGMVLLLMTLLVGALAGVAAWLLRSEGGTQWLLARLPYVRAEGVKGALLSDHFEADTLRVQWSGGQASVTISALRAEGLLWTWQPRQQAWLGLRAAKLSARQVVVLSGPHAPGKVTLPGSLQLPLQLAADAVRVEELRIDELAPFRRISGRAEIGGAEGHQAEVTSVEWDRLRLSGQARIGDQRPFAMSGLIQATPLATAEGWQASLRAGGTLERITLEARLQGRALRELAAPKADITTTVLPFAPWALGDLQAKTEALDLAALHSAAPQTSLSGHIDLRSSSFDAPITVSAQLDNALAGRWNERRLPLRRLQLSAQGQARQRDLIELKDVDLLLGSATQSAGRWQGQGRWSGHELQLDTTLTALQPQFIDGRAAAMTLAGPLSFTLRGLPSPDPAATGAAPAQQLSLRSTLSGSLAAAPMPVQLSVDATLDEGGLEVRQLLAQAGSAAAKASGSLRRAKTGGWMLASTGNLNEFDPLPWWPGDAGSAWRRGPHRLSADWSLDLRLPANPRQLAPPALVQAITGTGTLRVHDTVLAGVPVSLDLALGQTAAREANAPGSLRAEVQLAGNRATIEAQADLVGSGANDRWQFNLQAPALAALAPLFRLTPELAPWAPRAGNATVGLQTDGRWPQLRTRGHAQLKQLEAGEARVGTGSLRWNLDMQGSGSQPLELVAELSNIRYGRQRAEQLRAELSGALDDHKLRASAALPLTPPALAEQLLGVRALAGARMQLQAEGAWRGDGAGGGRWSGHVSKLAAGAWNGIDIVSDEAATPTDWLNARDLSGSVQIRGDGGLTRVQAAAGRMQFANTVALRWDEVDIDLAGARPNIQLRADIEPFAAAPLLARLQPTMGWSGDLRLAAKIDIRAAERFDADVVFERRDGDLHLADERGTQLLGLTDLRFGLAAHDGQWTLSQALAGRTIGEMAGAVNVKSTPERRWPAPESPLEGVVEAHVAKLGVWGTWVPPGWRLSGDLRTSATIGGRFGAPEYTGVLSGSGLGVRNLLQGVNISDGQLAIKLQGATAEIERFTLKGGDGLLTMSGGASFGSAPSARLKAVAERFRVLGRIDRQLTVSGNADLAFQGEQLKLDGRFKVDEGLFDTSAKDAPALDEDVTVRRPGDLPQDSAAASAQRTRRDVAVAIDIDLGEQLRVKGHGLDSALRGKLRVTTPGGRLAINGEVATEGGNYAAYGQKLDIERGIVAFSGPLENPRLDILALRPNTDTRVGVQISGTAQSPRARLYAETDMSETDRLSWLVLGRPSDGLAKWRERV